MGFVKEFKKIRDEFPEWEYLNEIGVRNMFGDPISNRIIELVVDRENNYFLIPQGHTNPNRDNVAISFYALCINGQVINIEAGEDYNGYPDEKYYKSHWIIEKITFPEKWNFNKITKEEFKRIVEEAFTIKCCPRYITEEWITDIKVEIVGLLVCNDEGGESNHENNR